MLLVPVHGFAGNPAMNYAGNAPVVMNYPCYSQFAFTSTGLTDAIWSRTGATNIVSCNATDANKLGFWGTGNVKVYATYGKTIINAILTYSSGLTSSTNAVINLTVDGDSVDGSYLGASYPFSDTLPVPYYRYRIHFEIAAVTGSGGNVYGQWARLDFVLA